MNGRKRALVVGALGVSGRHIVDELATRPDWDVIALARRAHAAIPNVRYVGADISDTEACRRALSPLNDVTHVFYAARKDDPDPATQSALNVAMLGNVLDAITDASPALQHVQLMHGMKAYGTLFGPFKTPALETDPRVLPPVTYYDQEDLIAARQSAARWSWSTLRPGAICGVSLGHSGNLVQILGVYGSICKALGVPLWYPGTPEGFRALRQVVDAGLLARAAIWVATHDACANQAFNVSNGDVFRWEHLWPGIADCFDVAPGGPFAVRLRHTMKDQGSLWEGIVQQHGLAPHAFGEVASWDYADVFHNHWDAFASDVRLRSTGFAEVVDTASALRNSIQSLRTQRIIP